jgi:hypothetical protein
LYKWLMKSQIIDISQFFRTILDELIQYEHSNL